jgi:hypothetical protein
MGVPIQNQARSAMGTQPTWRRQPAVCRGNQGNKYPIQQSQQMPSMPMGKGNVTNSATSGQPQMGMPNQFSNQG